MLQVDRRRHHLVPQRLHRNPGFQPARAAQQMPRHRLRRAHLQLLAQRMLAKYDLQRPRLIHVAQRRRRRMRIHVIDLLRLHLGVGQRRFHAALCALPFRSNPRHVERIRAHSIPAYLGQNRRASRLRVLQTFQHQNPRSLAHHESIAVPVKRPARPRRLLVPRRKRPHRRKTAHTHRRHRRLRTTRQHHVRVATLHNPERVPNRVRARRARRRRRRYRTLRPVTDARLPSRHVDNRPRDKKRRYLPRTARHQVRVLSLDDLKPANARADKHPHPLRIRRLNL